MSRSKWKGPYVEQSLLKKVNDNKNRVVVTDSRSSVIVPNFVGKTFSIHNGKIFYKIKVSESMVGYKLGEFSPTRKKFSFKKKKQK